MTSIAKADSASVGKRVIDLLKRLRPTRRRTELSELSDHLLADIGLDASAIATLRQERSLPSLNREDWR
jgi:hypothetical protein